MDRLDVGKRHCCESISEFVSIRNTSSILRPAQPQEPSLQPWLLPSPEKSSRKVIPSALAVDSGHSEVVFKARVTRIAVPHNDEVPQGLSQGAIIDSERVVDQLGLGCYNFPCLLIAESDVVANGMGV